MRKVTIGLVALVAAGFGATSAGAVEIESKAEKITITGRVQTMWYTSSIQGDPGNEFLVRRARVAMKMKINDWIGGIVEPDFAAGSGNVDLKDCYVKMSPNENIDIIMGQTKRRFDLFELTSSTQILVIERDGRIGRRKKPSLSTFTEGAGYSDRDVGLFVMAHDGKERFNFEGAVTNGAGANEKPTIGAKAFQGRMSMKPVAKTDFMFNVGVSVKPQQTVDATNDTSTAYNAAFEGSIEYGNFNKGPHVQAGLVIGDNPATYSATTDDFKSATAFQAIGSYKMPLQNNHWFESVEPLIRIGYADPNTDVDDDGGILLTPGINLFVVNRTRLSANIDIFSPQASGADTEVSFKAASWLYF
jgi:hypothetical protein